MSYVVYNKESTALVDTKRHQYAPKQYETERAAKSALTKAINNGILKGDHEEYGVAESSEYAANIEKMVTKTYIHPHTGKEATVTQSINTPRACDPTSDLYWSM